MIYFIEAVGANLLKIGFTDRDPEERLKELQTGCPHRLRVVGVWDEPASCEKYHHEQWQHLRETGEWFRIDERLRGYMWWLEFCKPYTDDRVHCSRGDAALVGAGLDRLAAQVAALEERNEFLEDQSRRLWKVVGIMNGWPDGECLPGCTVAVIPRPREARREYADCRM